MQKAVTVEDVLAAPETKPYIELLHGVVRRKAMPDFPHSLVQSEMARLIGNWSATAGGYTLTEQRCVLKAQGEEHVVLPDVGWWSPEQVPVPPLGPIRVSPLLAVEVLSPHDRYGEVQDKVLIYLNAGAAVVWVVDPLARNASIYRPGKVPQVLAPSSSLQDEVLPGLAIPLAEVLARVPYPPQPSIGES